MVDRIEGNAWELNRIRNRESVAVPGARSPVFRGTVHRARRRLARRAYSHELLKVGWKGRTDARADRAIGS